MRPFFLLFIWGTAWGQIVRVDVGPPLQTSGSGLDDASVSGTYTGVRANHSYRAVIAATGGGGDTVNYYRDGSGGIGPYALTTVPQPLYYLAGFLVGASWSAGTATFTVPAHGLTSGALVTITGASGGYNVTLVPVVVVDSSHFSVPMTSNPGSWISGGLATGSDGLKIQWAATSGHTVGDVWTVTATAAGAMGSFVQGGLSALTARDAEAKVRETFSATDFGAVSDFGARGGGHDNTAAFQAAIDAAGAGGAEINCPVHDGTSRARGISTGVYWIAAPLSTDNAAGSIHLTGGCAWRVFNPTPFATFLSVSSSNFEMDHLSISSPVGTFQRLAVISAASNVRLHNLKLTVSLTPVDNTKEQSLISYFGTDGFELVDSTLAITGSGITASGTLTSSGGSALVWAGGSPFTPEMAAGGGQIFLDKIPKTVATFTDSTDISITGTEAAGTHTFAVAQYSYVVVQKSASAERTRIEGNTIISTNIENPVSLFDCFDCWIANNFIDQGNFTLGPNLDGYGILIYAARTNPNQRDHVVGNTVQNAASVCIYFASVTDSEIRGNILSGCALQDPAPSLSIACIGWGGGARGVIADNVCVKSGQAGIDASQFQESPTGNSTLAITGNTITDAATFAIWLRGVNNCTVSGNTIDGRQEGTSTVDTVAGIWSGTGAQVAQCTITANAMQYLSEVGIGVIGGALDTVISANVIKHIGAGNAVLVVGGGSGGAVVNNVAADVGGGPGMDIEIPAMLVAGNSLRDVNGVYGYYIAGDNSSVQGNKAWNTAATATTELYVAGNNILVENNDLRGASTTVGIGHVTTITRGPEIGNQFADGQLAGQATLSSGTVTVSGCDCVNGVPQLTRGPISGGFGTLVVSAVTATSFTVLSLDPSTGSVVTSDGGVIYWGIRH